MILVLVDHDRGAVSDLSLQGVALGRQLASAGGDDLHALVVGSSGAAAAAGLGAAGVAVTHLAVHDGLTDYAPAAVARAAAELVASLSPRAVVAVGDQRGNEVMAHLGAITELPVAADCLTVTLPGILGDPTAVTRSRWGGNLIESHAMEGAAMNAIDTALLKAKSALRWRRPTSETPPAPRYPRTSARSSRTLGRGRCARLRV